jgi:phage baseplate assembly protein W
MTYYKGFSTKNWAINKSFAIHDIACVETDILNHIWTPLGSRVMMPAFGTRISSMPFELANSDTLNAITEDLTTVFNYDPRVKLINLSVNALPDNNMILAVATLFYIEFNVTQPLHIEIPTQ